MGEGNVNESEEGTVSTGFDRAKRQDGAKLSGATRKRLNEKGREAVKKLATIREQVVKWRDEAQERAKVSCLADYTMVRASYEHSQACYQCVLDLLDGLDKLEERKKS